MNMKAVFFVAFKERGKMKRIITRLFLIAFSFCLTAPVLAEQPTKEEIILKVKDAAMLILDKGRESAFKEINDKTSRFTWKGTYVFVIDFDGVMLARSFRTEQVVGKSFLNWKDKSNPPKHPIQEMIELAKTKGEGWVEYMYPKPGDDYEISHKKLGYVYKVPEHEMFVGAGIYE